MALLDVFLVIQDAAKMAGALALPTVAFKEEVELAYEQDTWLARTSKAGCTFTGRDKHDYVLAVLDLLRKCHLWKPDPVNEE